MPNMSQNVVVDPSSESAWKCNRCEHVFPKGLDMCPQCTSVSVTEVRMPKLRRGQVEAEEAALRAETAQVPSETGNAGLDSGSGGPENPSNPYENWTKRELQAECEKRSLPKSGNVTDLQDRLLEDDRAKAEAARGLQQEDITIEAHGTVTPPPGD